MFIWAPSFQGRLLTGGGVSEALFSALSRSLQMRSTLTPTFSTRTGISRRRDAGGLRERRTAQSRCEVEDETAELWLDLFVRGAA